MSIPKGKIIIISGASRGIGKALRALLSANGNTVINLSRGIPADDLSYSLDIGASEAEIKAVFDNIAERFGKIDILVCNAGYGLSGPTELVPESEIHRIVNTNFLGAIWCTRAALPYIPRGGRIIYTSSVSGIIPMPYRTMYNATKAGLTQFGMSMSLELSTLGISVTTLLVAAVKTDFAAHRAKIPTDDKRYSEAVNACDSFIDDKGGKNATGKLSTEQAARKIARIMDKKRPPIRALVATLPYHLAYPLGILFPSLVTKIVAKIFMGK